MKKNILYLLPILFISISCETQKKYEESNFNNDESASVYYDYEVLNEKWDNPILIQGSSFGNFFQQLYKQGLWDEMIRFTSQESIDKYGIDSIKNYYKGMDFGYDMHLRSRTIYNNITTLNYESIILGRKTITRINVVIENDTCRTVIDNTLFNLGVTWKMIDTEFPK